MPLGLPSKPLIPRSPEPLESETLATELDALSVFLPENSSSTSARARVRVAENLQAASRYASAVDGQDTSAASQTDTKRLDDFRQLLRQTQLAVEELKGDARALRGDLSELRRLGDHLGQGYTRLGDICRLTEKRSELTVDVLDAIEKRIEPLEVVRDLSATTEDSFASLKQLAEEVMQCAAGFEAQKEAIEQACEEATRVARLMEGLQARVAHLTEKTDWLGQAEETVGRLEHRAIDTTSLLERRVNDFDSQKDTIEHALGEATRVTAILSALEKRIAALTAGDRGLGYADDRIGRLEQRAVETTARLERRVNDFDARKQTIEHALVLARDESDRSLAHAEQTISHLGQRAAETTDRLDPGVNDFEAQKKAIEQSVIAALAASDRGLERAAGTVGQLEQRAATTAAQLDRRIADFDTQKQTIERAVAEATRVTAIMTAVEQRVATLAGSWDGLKQAEVTVAQLERRAADARLRLEQVVTDKDDVERELERVEKQLQTVTESARKSVKAVLRLTRPSRSPAWSFRWPLVRWATILAALVALELLGIFMLRTRDQPVQTARTAPVAHQSPVAAAVSPLPSKEARLAMFVMPAGSPGVPTTRIAASELSPTTRRDRARAIQTQPRAEAARLDDSVNQTVQQYVGVLTVDSEPTGSAVFVDRQHVGETPLELTQLRAGSHVVRIERDGYDRWTTAVLVAADKQTRVSAKLQALRDR